jgi:hypothetical protein
MISGVNAKSGLLGKVKMEKPVKSKRVFVAHFVNGQPAVSEKHTDARGTITFGVVLVLGKDKSIAFLAPGFGPADVKRFLTLLDKADQVAKAQRAAGPFDPLRLCDTAQNPIDMQQIMSLKILADYTSSVLIYAATIDTYLNSPVADRFVFDYSLDLYRQAMGFHDLPSLTQLIAQDAPYIQSLPLGQHQRETIYDALYYMAHRIQKRDAAFEFLQRAWAARHSLARAAILIDEAAFFQKSDLIVEIAQVLAQAGRITPRNLAQLAVAHQRLGRRQDAYQALQTLSAVQAPEAQKLAQKIAQFLSNAAP